MQNKLLNVQILPTSQNPAFDQRESGLAHTSYLEETAFYSYLQAGDVDMIEKCLGEFLEKGVVIGHLSNDNLRQMQYWAVCCITLGIRYAIQGGLEEMTAFNLSDAYIMQIDKMQNGDEITAFLERTVIELTRLVRESSLPDCPVEIQKCINYINTHLHEQITLDDLSDVSGYSRSYLSKKFNSCVGYNVSDYIMKKRLQEAKALLQGENQQKYIAYYLGFCSQAHFISHFKKEFGVTPRQYQHRTK